MAARRSDQEVEERRVDGEGLAGGSEVGDARGGFAGGGGEDRGGGAGEGGEGEVEGADVGVYCWLLRSVVFSACGVRVSMEDWWKLWCMYARVIGGGGKRTAYSRNSRRRRKLGDPLGSRLLSGEDTLR